MRGMYIMEFTEQNQDVKQQKVVFFMSTLQTYYQFKQLDFYNVDQHTGVKSLIHSTKHLRDNQLQRLELPWRKFKHHIKESEGNIQYSRRMSRGGNIQGVVHFQNQNYSVTESPKCNSNSNEWSQESQ